MIVYHANKATSKADAEQIVARAEFRVFGQGIIDIVKQASHVESPGQAVQGTPERRDLYFIKAH